MSPACAQALQRQQFSSLFEKAARGPADLAPPVPATAADCHLACPALPPMECMRRDDWQCVPPNPALSTPQSGPSVQKQARGGLLSPCATQGFPPAVLHGWLQLAATVPFVSTCRMNVGVRMTRGRLLLVGRQTHARQTCDPPVAALVLLLPASLLTICTSSTLQQHATAALCTLHASSECQLRLAAVATGLH